MQEYVLLFNSVTHAIKARRLLLHEGISCTLQRIKPSDAGGCGYGVSIVNADLLTATLLLREASIPYRMQT